MGFRLRIAGAVGFCRPLLLPLSIRGAPGLPLCPARSLSLGSRADARLHVLSCSQQPWAVFSLGSGPCLSWGPWGRPSGAERAAWKARSRAKVLRGGVAGVTAWFEAGLARPRWGAQGTGGSGSGPRLPRCPRGREIGGPCPCPGPAWWARVQRRGVPGSGESRDARAEARCHSRRDGVRGGGQGLGKEGLRKGTGKGEEGTGSGDRWTRHRRRREVQGKGQVRGPG